MSDVKRYGKQQIKIGYIRHCIECHGKLTIAVYDQKATLAELREHFPDCLFIMRSTWGIVIHKKVKS